MRAWVLTALSLLAGSAGCNIDLGGSQTKGALGRVSFAYQSGQGCFFGCDLGRPMLRGTRELLSASGPASLSGATLQVEPFGVVQIVDSDSRPDGQGNQVRGIDVSAIGVGAAELTISDARGALIDRVTLTVHDAAVVSAEWAILVPDAKLGVREENRSTSSNVQLSDNDGAVTLSAFDAGGQRLQADNGFSVTLSDPAVVTSESLTSDSSLWVLHRALTGNTTFTATTRSGASTQLAITSHAP